MPASYLLLIFIILIVILSLMRTRLVYELSGMSLLLFGDTKPGIVFYSLVFLPGTIIHELSHWIVAEILQVRTGAITIFPDLEDDDNRHVQRLGSVATVKTDPFRGFLIGLAPFLSGLVVLVVLGRFLFLGWGNYLWWQLALIIYGIMVIGNSMMISESDRRTWPFIIIFFLFVLVVLSIYYPVVFTGSNSFLNNLLKPLNQVLGMTAGLNLVMIGGLYAIRRVVESVTKKKIIHK